MSNHTAEPPSSENQERRKPILLGLIFYRPDADAYRFGVHLSPICRGMLSELTDFELKVFAAEVGLVVRQRFEMPPSPLPPRADEPWKDIPPTP